MKKKSKLYMALALTLAMIFVLSGVCSAKTYGNKNKKDTAPVEEEAPDFETWNTIVTEGVLDVPIVWEEIPKGYNSTAKHMGTVLRMHYTTDVYEDGIEYEKYCTVYLPYGYDQDDTETKYNVLYFQHGNGQNPNMFWDSHYKPTEGNNLFANLFDDEIGLMDKFIIICPTYYLEVDEKGVATAASTPAGDGRYEGIPGNYTAEIIDDLIPQIESQFNVYCEDFSREGIKASRDHRAFGGYSRGSRCTWDVLHDDFEYFKYWMPCSGIVAPVDGTDASTAEAAYAYVSEPILANPDLDFYLMGYIGGPVDQRGRELFVELMQYINTQKDIFSYGTDPEVNNFYFVMSDFPHMDLYFPFILANARNFLFK